MYLFFFILINRHENNITPSLLNQKISLSLPPPISIINNPACGLGIMMNSVNMSSTINPATTTIEHGNVLTNHSTSGAALHGNFLINYCVYIEVYMYIIYIQIIIKIYIYIYINCIIKVNWLLNNLAIKRIK